MRITSRRLLAAVVAAGMGFAPAGPALALSDGLVRPVQFGFGNNRQQADAQVRIGQLEEQLRRMNGQIEQLSHQLRQMQDQMQRMQEDTEYRLQQLEGGQPRRQNLEQPATGPAPQRDANAGDPATTGSTGSIGDGGPLDLSALARGDAIGSAIEQSAPSLSTSPSPSQDSRPSSAATETYEAAYDYILAGDYAGAEAAFRSFLQLYPNDPRAGDAQFWIGESLLQSGQHRQAAEAFLKSYTDHPDSDKAPDSLLKLGMALSGMGEGQAACSSFSELLSSYPSADPSLLDRARQERQRAGCA
ncbi:tol-pal system protein YbgF [Amorphus orientalis]|uniref:Cell division coordinator CpoB n=1 Tax=Amorphus orientalis TaxID=649198 RepID=A0AAE3VL06_9HYPH|nr:tol-pal system protein YbgF [Amorphus orientalis]MDQ0313967.1 tol-pal system protein YbgF [Amorphus orientalis]